MNRNFIRIPALLLALLTVFCLCGCGLSTEQKASADSGKIKAYYLDADALGLQSTEYTPKSTTASDEVHELLTKLSEVPENTSWITLLPADVTINSVNIDNSVLSLDFSSSYTSMEKSREVLARAGIVRTMITVTGIKYVTFTVEGDDLTASDGSKIGLMNADTFIENTGRQINSYQHTNINLYFANAAGDKLVKESRSIYYSSNKTLEWAIMERLVSGPKVTGNNPTMPSETQILGVSTQDGVCYVNLSKEFVSGALSIDENLPIYSIVNSLTDNCHVQQVQIAIEGVTAMTFRDHMSLDKLYKKNTDLVES